MSTHRFITYLRQLKTDLQGQIDALEASISDTVETALAEMAARVGKLEEYWAYLEWKYNHEYVKSTNGSSETVWTETLKEGESVKGTCVATIKADGKTYTQTYTIGQTTRTLTSVKQDDNNWKETWS